MFLIAFLCSRLEYSYHKPRSPLDYTLIQDKTPKPVTSLDIGMDYSLHLTTASSEDEAHGLLEAAELEILLHTFSDHSSEDDLASLISEDEDMLTSFSSSQDVDPRNPFNLIHYLLEAVNADDRGGYTRDIYTIDDDVDESWYLSADGEIRSE